MSNRKEMMPLFILNSTRGFTRIICFFSHNAALILWHGSCWMDRNYSFFCFFNYIFVLPCKKAMTAFARKWLISRSGHILKIDIFLSRRISEPQWPCCCSERTYFNTSWVLILFEKNWLQGESWTSNGIHPWIDPIYWCTGLGNKRCSCREAKIYDIQEQYHFCCEDSKGFHSN